MTRQCIFFTLAFVLFCAGCHNVSTVEGEVFKSKLLSENCGLFKLNFLFILFLYVYHKFYWLFST